MKQPLQRDHPSNPGVGQLFTETNLILTSLRRPLESLILG